MKLTADYTLDAVPDRVYAALVDASILQRCLPGCEVLTPVGDDRYEAQVKIGVAGLKGTYTGRAELRDKHPPDGFTLAVDGKGAPGFVRSTARVGMESESPYPPGNCRLARATASRFTCAIGGN